MAAQRLIAQFEGKALGRHNSNTDLNPSARRVAPAPAPTENRSFVRFAHSPAYCRIGECVKEIKGADFRARFWRVPVRRRPIDIFDMYDADNILAECSFDAWEFEAVRIITPDSRARKTWEWVWKRIG
jgi:hypothetical protein